MAIFTTPVRLNLKGKTMLDPIGLEDNLIRALL